MVDQDVVSVDYEELQSVFRMLDMLKERLGEAANSIKNVEIKLPSSLREGLSTGAREASDSFLKRLEEYKESIVESTRGDWEGLGDVVHKGSSFCESFASLDMDNARKFVNHN